MMNYSGLVCCLWPLKGGVELWLNAFSFDPAGQGEPGMACPLIDVAGFCEHPFQRASGCVGAMRGAK